MRCLRTAILFAVLLIGFAACVNGQTNAIQIATSPKGPWVTVTNTIGPSGFVRIGNSQGIQWGAATTNSGSLIMSNKTAFFNIPLDLTSYSTAVKTLAAGASMSFMLSLSAPGQTNFTVQFPPGTVITTNVVSTGGNTNLTGQGYYIDYVGGSDSLAGTNIATAWKHCPGDPKATETASNATLTAGNVVYFKGGENYVLTAPNIGSAETAGIAVKWSGTTGNPITYTSTNAWGITTNRAVITDNYGSNMLAAFYSPNGFSNIVFNNLEIGPVGGTITNIEVSTGSPLNPSWGIDCPVGQTNVTVENCYFHNIGYAGECYSPQGACYTAKDFLNIIVSNDVFTFAPTALELGTVQGSSNITVVACQFLWSFNWTIDMPISSPDGVFSPYRDAYFIHNNTFYNTEVVTGTWGPSTNCAESGNWHSNAIYSRGSPSAAAGGSANPFLEGSNMDVYANTFYADNGNVDGGLASGVIHCTGSTSLNIYNNLLVDNSVSDGYLYDSIDGYTVTNHYFRVINNTVVEWYNPMIFQTVGDPGQTAPPQPFNFECLGPSQRTFTANNIVYEQEAPPDDLMSAGFTNAPPGGTNSLAFDHDDFYNVSNTPSSYLYFNGSANPPGIGGPMNLGSLQANGWETHGTNLNPGFVSVTYGPNQTNTILNNYQVSPSSSIYGNGSNLTTAFSWLPGITVTRGGTNRPSTGSNGWMGSD
jgi:hypothetical protein